MTFSKEQLKLLKQLANNLIDDGENVEYTRGICELIADIDPAQDVSHEERSEQIKAEILWSRLGDIPIDSDEQIETPFLHFPIGTDREEIWSWFEETFNLSVAKDLMNLK